MFGSVGMPELLIILIIALISWTATATRARQGGRPDD